MARNLKTGWVIIATSGSTVDGREIKKDWLTDMATHYSEKLFSAKIWPDHERIFGAQGKVLALKTEDATEPALKGEIHLMAILAPSDELVWANKQGKFTQTSIEVRKNFGNKGFVYLGGLAVTDTPASLGTTELQFNENADGDIFYIHGSPVDLSGAKDEPEKSIFSFFRKPSPEPEQDTPMTAEQFQALLAAQQQTAAAIVTLGDQFKTLQPATPPVPATAPAPTTPPAPEPTAEFVSKKDYAELANKLKTLDDKFTELQKTPAGSTTPAGDHASAENAVIC